MLGPGDYEALWLALRAGFGWESLNDLRDLCCALWAKSRREQEIVAMLFAQLDVADWRLPTLEARPRIQDDDTQPSPVSEEFTTGTEPEVKPSPEPELPPKTVESPGGLPPILVNDIHLPDQPFIFVPQFDLTYREVAQAWRRLRQMDREGPPVELDLDATIAQRCRMGIVSDVVMVPRRRNTDRLLLLVDSQGSMAPMHRFVTEVCQAIQQASRLEDIALYYFHDTPSEGANEVLLEEVPAQLVPTLDLIFSKIHPLTEGALYGNADFTEPTPIPQVLDNHAHHAAVVLVSDAGAARKHYDLLRLLDTVAFLKALRVYTSRIVWLNPLPRPYWQNTTASQIARYLPMFSMDQGGMYAAVDTLRGRPFTVEVSL